MAAAKHEMPGDLIGLITTALLDQPKPEWMPFKWVADEEIHVRHRQTGVELVILVRRKT